MRYFANKDKKEAFNRIWFKKYNSPMRDRLKSKLMVRGVEPTEKNAFEYWMGYIRPVVDVRTGDVSHVNPRWSKYKGKKNNEKRKGNNRKPRRMGGHNKKKN
tara:strand:+ start:1921 stop:2226 length:306 start_codon:yes stop_codon:yes gene_type:complete